MSYLIDRTCIYDYAYSSLQVNTFKFVIYIWDEKAPTCPHNLQSKSPRENRELEEEDFSVGYKVCFCNIAVILCGINVYLFVLVHFTSNVDGQAASPDNKTDDKNSHKLLVILVELFCCLLSDI